MFTYCVTGENRKLKPQVNPSYFYHLVQNSPTRVTGLLSHPMTIHPTSASFGPYDKNITFAQSYPQTFPQVYPQAKRVSFHRIQPRLLRTS